jgi:hypothetical protein
MRLLVLVLVSLATLAASAAAQLSIDVGPLAGYYRPFGRFAPADILSTDMPMRPQDLSGPMLGAVAHVAIRGRFGFDALAATATSTLPSCTCPGGPTGVTHARVNLAALEGQYDISLSPGHYHLWLGAGPAIVQHAGTGYARYGSPKSVAGGFSLRAAAPLGSHFQLDASAMGMGYSFNQEFPPEHGPQLDALATVGLRWHWSAASASRVER